MRAESPESCPTLCDAMDCSLPGSSAHGDSPGKTTGVGCHALHQGIFLTQGSNPHLLHLLHWQAGSLPLASLGSPYHRWLSGQESARQCRGHRRCRFNPWVGKILLEQEMATHSSTLAWKITWTEPGGLQSMGLQRIRHNLAAESDIFTHWNFMHLSKTNGECLHVLLQMKHQGI